MTQEELIERLEKVQKLKDRDRELQASVKDLLEARESINKTLRGLMEEGESLERERVILLQDLVLFENDGLCPWYHRISVPKDKNQ